MPSLVIGITYVGREQPDVGAAACAHAELVIAVAIAIKNAPVEKNLSVEIGPPLAAIRHKAETAEPDEHRGRGGGFGHGRYCKNCIGIRKPGEESISTPASC